MSRPKINPTGREVQFDHDEIIVSKTDLKGIIRYANDIFLRVSGYSESELLGQPHNILRHPEMPRCIFKLLWETIQSGSEIFAYVNNLAKNGDHYWVFAHITPSYNLKGEHVGYHSNRRVPHADALAKVKPLYARLLSEERRHAEPRRGMEAGSAQLHKALAETGLDYSQFVFSLSEQTNLTAAIQ